MLDFTDKLQEINGRLKVDQVQVRIDAKGQRLMLRAMLPPKPESTRNKPYQQKIYTGKPKKLAGLREAEKLARLLGAQILAEKFTWDE